MHNGTNHWLMTFSPNFLVQVCDSLYTNLSPIIKNCLQVLYKSKVEKSRKLSVTILPVQKQSCGYSCGLFEIAFATGVLNGLSPVDYCHCVKYRKFT